MAKAHQYEELTKIFIKPEEFIIVLDEKDVNASNSISQEEFDNNRELTDKINKSFEFSLDESREQLAKICSSLLTRSSEKDRCGEH